MVLVDQALGHGGGGERQVVALDHLAQQRGIARCASRTSRCTAIGRLAAAISSPARATAASGAGAIVAGGSGGRQRLVGGRERHVLRQVEMHRPHRLAQRERDRLRSRSRAIRPRSSRSVALVIGLNSAWWSIHIWMRRPSWSVLRLQVMAIIGERSSQA